MSRYTVRVLAKGRSGAYLVEWEFWVRAASPEAALDALPDWAGDYVEAEVCDDAGRQLAVFGPPGGD